MNQVWPSKAMQQNLWCLKYDLELGSTQGAQVEAKGDRAKDGAGDKATIYGWGSVQETTYRIGLRSLQEARPERDILW